MVFAEARVFTVTIQMVQLYGFQDFVLVCLPKVVHLHPQETFLLHVKCVKEQCHAEKSLHLGRRLDRNKLIEFFCCLDFHQLLLSSIISCDAIPQH